MADSPRRSHICGSINSMYYVDPSKAFDSRYDSWLVRVQTDRIHQSTCLKQSYSLQNFQQQILITSYTAWILLLISSLCSSFVTPWLLVDVKAEGFTRNGWRSLVTAFYLAPFLLHEQRTLKQPAGQFRKQLTRQKLRPIFVSTVNFCIWLLCLIYACKHTSMNHSVFLCCIRFYAMTLVKMKRGDKIHQFQIGGSILCTVGVLLILGDSLSQPQLQPGPEISRYLTVAPWKRVVLGDSLGIFASFVAVYLDQWYQVPDMPKFTYMFFYNLFICVNSITFGYFFGGSVFSFNPKFGILGLFTYENFVSILYVSVLLGLWMVISNILIAQIFNTVIIDIASTFQLLICCFIWDLFGLQHFPPGMTCIGYAFLMPGLVFIIGGKGVIDDVDNKINFELYRPTEVKVYNSFRSALRLTLKGSAQFDRQIQTPIKKQFGKSSRLPFAIIIEQQQNQRKQHKQSQSKTKSPK